MHWYGAGGAKDLRQLGQEKITLDHTGSNWSLKSFKSLKHVLRSKSTTAYLQGFADISITSIPNSVHVRAACLSNNQAHSFVICCDLLSDCFHMFSPSSCFHCGHQDTPLGERLSTTHTAKWSWAQIRHLPQSHGSNNHGKNKQSSSEDYILQYCNMLQHVATYFKTIAKTPESTICHTAYREAR